MPVANTGLASGGQTFEGESSCGLSRPNAKPRTVGTNFRKTKYIPIDRNIKRKII